MAIYNKYQPFVAALASKQHDLNADQLMIALSNVAPNPTHGQLSQVTQISYTNLSSRILVTVSSGQVGGQYKIVVADLSLIAIGGNVGPFRYIHIYNDTSVNDLLICYYDIGTAVTLLDGGDPLPLDFNQVSGLFVFS